MNVATRTPRRPALLVLALFAAGACGPDRVETSSSFSYVIRSDQPTSSITLDGVRIVIDNEVSIRSDTVENLGTGGAVPSLKDIGSLANPRFTIAGAELALRGKRLFLGESDYGAVAPGDDVLIDSDGVSVNGEPRGPLP